MIWSGKTAGVATLALLAVATAAGAQTPTTAPPIVMTAPEPAPVRLQAYRLTEPSAQATCDGRPIAPTRQEAFPPRLSTPTPHQASWPVRDDLGPPLLFDIDAQGHPASVRPEPHEPPLPIGPGGDRAETEAVFASWRFEPRARRNCRLTFSGTPVALDRAPAAALGLALALHDGNPAWEPVMRQALQRPGDDCRRRPRVRTAAYPSLRRPDLPPHSRVWSAIRFDVDDQGRTRAVETVAASHDPGTDAAFQQAVSETVFAAGNPRTGCLVTFSLFGESDPSDRREPPSVDHLNQCSAEVEDRFTHGRLEYPEALRRRGVEGWAVVRYDIATWGAPGGIQVLESEPVSAFGAQGSQIVRSGRATPAPTHATGCVDRVIFRLSDDEEAQNAD